MPAVDAEEATSILSRLDTASISVAPTSDCLAAACLVVEALEALEIPFQLDVTRRPGRHDVTVGRTDATALSIESDQGLRGYGDTAVGFAYAVARRCDAGSPRYAAANQLSEPPETAVRDAVDRDVEVDEGVRLALEDPVAGLSTCSEPLTRLTGDQDEAAELIGEFDGRSSRELASAAVALASSGARTEALESLVGTRLRTAFYGGRQAHVVGAMAESLARTGRGGRALETLLSGEGIEEAAGVHRAYERRLTREIIEAVERERDNVLHVDVSDSVDLRAVAERVSRWRGRGYDCVCAVDVETHEVYAVGPEPERALDVDAGDRSREGAALHAELEDLDAEGRVTPKPGGENR
ncbi:MAG: hypothetical protein ACLFMT_06090 [Halobacteriales archaeon]